MEGAGSVATATDFSAEPDIDPDRDIETRPDAVIETEIITITDITVVTEIAVVSETSVATDVSTTATGFLSTAAPDVALPEAMVTAGGAWGGGLATPIEAEPDPGQEPIDGPKQHRRRWLRVAMVVVVAAFVAVAVRVERPVPTPPVRVAIATSLRVGGVAPVLPWPAAGQAAVAVPSLGVSIESGPNETVPIASLTKLMTAYLLLHDHPLAVDAPGPVLKMTAADQSEAAAEATAGATSVPVQAGEELNQRQLLNGLMVHSANNFADVLARWDAGTVPAFVTKMNTAATALGMHHTHYADASGLDPGTAGSAGDQLRVTAAAMAIPAFAAVVAQKSVTLPIAGTLYNYVKAVGADGIVGVKSGFTQAAMGCLVLAGERTVAGHKVLVLASVTGQTGLDPLDTATQADVTLIDAVASALRALPVTARNARVATVTLPWAHKSVPVVTARAADLLVWPGQVVRMRIAAPTVRAGVPAGARVGTLSVSTGPERVLVPIRVTHALTGPSLRWRLAG